MIQIFIAAMLVLATQAQTDEQTFGEAIPDTHVGEVEFPEDLPYPDDLIIEPYPIGICECYQDYLATGFGAWRSNGKKSTEGVLEGDCTGSVWDSHELRVVRAACPTPPAGECLAESICDCWAKSQPGGECEGAAWLSQGATDTVKILAGSCTGRHWGQREMNVVRDFCGPDSTCAASTICDCYEKGKSGECEFKWNSHGKKSVDGVLQGDCSGKKWDSWELAVVRNTCDRDQTPLGECETATICECFEKSRNGECPGVAWKRHGAKSGEKLMSGSCTGTTWDAEELTFVRETCAPIEDSCRASTLCECFDKYESGDCPNSHWKSGKFDPAYGMGSCTGNHWDTFEIQAVRSACKRKDYCEQLTLCECREKYLSGECSMAWKAHGAPTVEGVLKGACTGEEWNPNELDAIERVCAPQIDDIEYEVEEPEEVFEEANVDYPADASNTDPEASVEHLSKAFQPKSSTEESQPDNTLAYIGIALASALVGCGVALCSSRLLKKNHQLGDVRLLTADEERVV